jgi:D-serine deaminase-like pyridoxal phosphate-dependent protein
MPQPRLQFLNLPDAKLVLHSEEHLVVETPEAINKRVGDVVYALPWHVCPTVALHDEVIVVAEGRPMDRWRVAARTRVMKEG